uniref:Uncharacterized protein n=1 Tax=Lepeophtheirus salmonis TaxID=72036 RepID=A0A0K2U300_LEPSM
MCPGYIIIRDQQSVRYNKSKRMTNIPCISSYLALPFYISIISSGPLFFLLWCD